MEIVLAKHAGFCYGVKRAVDIANEHANKEYPIYTLGPLIHNDEVINDLALNNVFSKSLEELMELDGGKVIIRSHGVGKDTIDKLKDRGYEVIDATCPFVKKIHNLVHDYSKNGYHIIILGDKKHAEVQGIIGWVFGEKYSVIETKEDIESFDGRDKKCCLVAQTTFNNIKFQEYVEIINQKGYDVVALDTICSATYERQRETEDIASKVGAMIVIGDRNSSNSRKLFEIAKSKCKSFFVQTGSDIDLKKLHSFKTVGITAGASTPDKIIREVMNECQK